MNTSVRTLLIVVAAGLLAGCAFLRGSAQGTAFVSDDMRHMRLPETAERAVAFRSPYEIQEYLRSRTDGRAEALYFRSRSRNTVLDFEPGDLAAVNRHWRFNASAAEIRWSTERAVQARTARAYYRRYERVGRDTVRDCFAFIRTWDRQSLDPWYRPRQAYVGYRCRPVGDTLTAAAIDAYLARIHVTDADVPGFYIGQTVPRDAAARALARGRGEAGWGITGFPLRHTAHFPIGAAFDGGGSGG